MDKKKPDCLDNEGLSFNNAYLKYRRTKIVATIGPASLSPAILARIIKAGADIIRVNFSHGKGTDHVRAIRMIRRVAERCRQPIAVLADLCGPKIRVGEFEGGSVDLVQGSKVRITSRQVLGKAGLIPSQYKGIEKEVVKGHRILLDDGNLEMKVLGLKDGMVEALVVRGGKLKDHKGMNMPDSDLRTPALTAKDKKDVGYALKAGVDFIALSFVRKAEDVVGLKRFLKVSGAEVPVISKIETPQSLEDIRNILRESDGIMVARGDLGVEMPAQKVPLIQNELVKLACQANKPVIVATQMLESMIDHGQPTRAEVTDVASACMSGADAVMLSAETAAGKYPVEAVTIMDSVLAEVEAYQWAHGRFSLKDISVRKEELQNALSIATGQLSRDLKVRCIVVLTRSGRTGRIVSSDKPAARVFALSVDPKVVRRLNLMWGVVPFRMKRELKFSEYVGYAEKLVKSQKIGRKGDHILILSGLTDKSPVTNSIVVHKLN